VNAVGPGRDLEKEDVYHKQVAQKVEKYHPPLQSQALPEAVLASILESSKGFWGYYLMFRTSAIIILYLGSPSTQMASSKRLRI
jgi:hypothetical protein